VLLFLKSGKSSGIDHTCFFSETHSSGEGGEMSAVLRYRLTALVTAAALIALAIVSPDFLWAQVQDVSADVRTLVEKYEEVFNAHKSSAVAAFFSKDADMILGNGPKIVGRKAIQEWWTHYFSRIDEERKGTLEIDSIRVISPEVILINLDTTTAGPRSTGEELPTRLARGRFQATSLLVSP
jgi:uncharacterized protein (TIGR02246 family)